MTNLSETDLNSARPHPTADKRARELAVGLMGKKSKAWRARDGAHEPPRTDSRRLYDLAHNAREHQFDELTLVSDSGERA